MLARVDFLKWEIDELVRAMELQPQEHVNRDLMEKLWRAQRMLKQRDKTIERPRRK